MLTFALRTASAAEPDSAWIPCAGASCTFGMVIDRSGCSKAARKAPCPVQCPVATCKGMTCANCTCLASQCHCDGTALILTTKVRPCPHCGSPTVHSGGCPRIRCVACGTRWDWSLYDNQLAKAAMQAAGSASTAAGDGTDHWFRALQPLPQEAVRFKALVAMLVAAVAAAGALYFKGHA